MNAYIFFPFCQRAAPNIKEDAMMIDKRAKLYLGLLQ